MKLFDVWRLTSLLHRIEGARRDGIAFEMQHGKRDAPVDEDFRLTWIEPILQDARLVADIAELDSTRGRVNEHSGGLTVSLDGITYQELDHELKVLRESIQIDLSDKFVYIVEDSKRNYNTKDLYFEIWDLSGFYFPAIRKDAIAAMRAYVFDLNTSCVFHLMRITEIGLRALARRMKVRLPRGKQLEWAQWNEILIEMRKKTDVIANRPANNARDELLEFYRGAIGEFQGYKDAYRNFIMHMREKIEYDANEARSLIDRVSHFMNRLSKNIDEDGHVLTEDRKKKILAKMDAKIEAAKQEQKEADEQRKQGIREVQCGDATNNTGSAQPDTGGTGSREAAENKEAEKI